MLPRRHEGHGSSRQRPAALSERARKLAQRAALLATGVPTLRNLPFEVLLTSVRFDVRSGRWPVDDFPTARSVAHTFGIVDPTTNRTSPTTEMGGKNGHSLGGDVQTFGAEAVSLVPSAF